jgi:cytochrome d ubiquinol oxidase subunit II
VEALWFALAAAVATAYVVLDGFDLGAGVLHHAVARDDRERRQVLGAIGPFWDGNEVWLLVLGGVLFLAFPRVLAVGLSGLYLAIFLLVWILILRGIAIELRSHVADRTWRGFWDGVFTLASTLAPVVLGAALGNLLRGVPIQAEGDADGWFALSLFESFSPTGELGILDWYTVLVGALALVALTHHGALFLAWKTDGAVRERSRAWAARLFPALLALWLVATVATARVAPPVFAGLRERPLAWAATAVLAAGIAASFAARRRGRDLAAFLGSCAFLTGMLAATAASTYPTLIRAVPDAARSLTASDAASAPAALAAALWWWPAGAALVGVYYAVLFRFHRGRVRATDEEGEGY